MDKLVKAIRDHHLVGVGTCSTIDECWEDAEIAEALEQDGITTETSAIQWAMALEGLHMEQMLNCRWGEDSDPELEMYREWKDKCKQYDRDG